MYVSAFHGHENACNLKMKRKKARKGFWPPRLCRELDIFKIGNFLRNCFFGFFRDFFAEIFWIFLGFFWGEWRRKEEEEGQ